MASPFCSHNEEKSTQVSSLGFSSTTIKTSFNSRLLPFQKRKKKTISDLKHLHDGFILFVFLYALVAVYLTRLSSQLQKIIKTNKNKNKHLNKIRLVSCL